MAVLPNVPADVSELAVEDPQFMLPSAAGGRKERKAMFVLVAGETNRLSIQLERREKTPIAHY